MGHAIDALTDVPVFVRHNPVIPGMAWVAAIVSAGLGAALAFVPGGRIVNALLVTPFFVAGMLALVWAGRDGSAEVGDFLAGVREHYVTLVAAYAISAALYVGLLFEAMAVMVAAATVAVAGLALGSGAGSPAPGTGTTAPGSGGAIGGAGAPELFASFGIAIFVGLAILIGVAFVLAAILGLVDVAVVVGEESVLSAIGLAWVLFREEPLSVVGYTLLRGIIGIVLLVVPLAAAIGIPMVVDLPEGGGLALFAVVGLVFLPLAYLVGLTYHVSFFNRVTAS